MHAAHSCSCSPESFSAISALGNVAAAAAGSAEDLARGALLRRLGRWAGRAPPRHRAVQRLVVVVAAVAVWVTRCILRSACVVWWVRRRSAGSASAGHTRRDVGTHLAWLQSPRSSAAMR
jgi:hypothetical protein